MLRARESCATPDDGSPARVLAVSTSSSPAPTARAQAIGRSVCSAYSQDKELSCSSIALVGRPRRASQQLSSLPPRPCAARHPSPRGRRTPSRGTDSCRASWSGSSAATPDGREERAEWCRPVGKSFSALKRARMCTCDAMGARTSSMERVCIREERSGTAPAPPGGPLTPTSMSAAKVGGSRIVRRNALCAAKHTRMRGKQ